MTHRERTTRHRLRGDTAVSRWAMSAFVAVLVMVATGSVLQAEVETPAAPPDAARTDPLTEAARRYFPSDDAVVPPKRLFRLTRDQLDATVASLFPKLAVTSVKATVARDPLQMNYEYAELLSFNAANTSALAAWIESIAAEARKSPAGVVDCAASGNGPECLAAAARAFIVKAFRGDVTDDRADRIVDFYLRGVKASGLGPATGDLVEVVLKSPDFLFRKELEVDRYRRLAPAQLLQSLTYTIADAPPEKLGLRSEKAGEYLFKGDSGRATVDAIIASADARAKLRRFFTAWLEIKDPGDFTISQHVYPDFDAKLAAAMVDDTRRFLDVQLSKPDPMLKDITQSTQAVVSPALAPIYQTAAATGAVGRLVDVDATQRLGIFSQPAVLASHSGPTGTRPIKRGVFWVRKVMCMELDPPPNGIDTALYESEHTTERQRIEQVTGQRACVGCHKVIDPFGFFLEPYDALGRWRTKDNGFAIDPSIAINFLDEGPTKSSTPVEALRIFTGSMMFKQCFVRQLFRFYMGRSEEPADEPLLREAFLGLARTDRILDVVRTLATSDRIGRRQ